MAGCLEEGVQEGRRRGSLLQAPQHPTAQQSPARSKEDEVLRRGLAGGAPLASFNVAAASAHLDIVAV